VPVHILKIKSCFAQISQQQQQKITEPVENAGYGNYTMETFN
jgi:hypothetical protein